MDTLKDIDIRSALISRTQRPPNYEIEHGALQVLTAELTENPRNMLQKLVETARDLCDAGSAGISLLEGDRFRWEALSGALAPFHSTTMPRDASPCGVCVDQNTSQLMYMPVRHFSAVPVEPRIVELLLIPFHDHGRPIGTVWIVAHNDERQFDGEDERIIRILAKFASAGWQLWKASEAAAESSRHKDEFAAMLGHELRNPLAAILNANDVVRQLGNNDPGIKQAADIVMRQAKHIGRMVEDLIDLSRLNRGQLELRKEIVQLGSFVGHAVETARPQIERHEHQLSVEIPPEPISVEGDPLRLAQLISNLLDNAAKYTPNGGEISLVAEVAGGEVRIRIRDNGIGIPADRLDSIFGLYTQLEPAAAFASSGLGLGLALVRTLADMHGGKVEVTSDGPGRGSQFTIRLPISAGLRPLNGALEVANSSMAPPFPRILLVDDNEDATEAMRQLLSMDGHTVRAARNGAIALEELSLFDPDVVLLDLGLPDMDGHQVALKMREQTSRKDLLIIALTGYGREQDRRLSTAAGCDGHLVKPIQLDTLKSFLARARRPVSSQVGNKT